MSTKKTKRIISLILALTMIFTFMAMAASAATTEVQPRATCPNCGGWDTVTGSRSTVLKEEYKSRCSKMTIAHIHVTYLVEDFSRCRSCGYEVIIDDYYHTVCK